MSWSPEPILPQLPPQHSPSERLEGTDPILVDLHSKGRKSDFVQTTPSSLPVLLNDKQLAAYLDCSLRFVRRLAIERRMAYLPVKRRRRYRVEDVLAYLDKERKVSLEPHRRAARSPHKLVLLPATPPAPSVKASVGETATTPNPSSD